MTMSFREYRRAQGLPEAIALLNEPGCAALVLAGGTELVVRLRRGSVSCDRVVDIARLPELRQIDLPAQGPITLGAALTLAELLALPALAERVPLLATTCRAVRGMQRRNQATLGGAIAAIGRYADVVTALVCLDARAVLAGPEGEQTIAVVDLLRAGVPSGHLICAVTFAPPPDPARTRYLHLDHGPARIGVAACGALDSTGRIAALRLAVGGTDFPARRAEAIEAALIGQAPDPAAYARAATQFAEGIVASGAPSIYERRALAVLVEDALNSALGI